MEKRAVKISALNFLLQLNRKWEFRDYEKSFYENEGVFK